MKVGFIGLGIMGSRMAANLQKRGYEIIIHNRTKEKGKALLDQGADWANSPAELAGKVDCLFTMLSAPEIVMKMAFGPDGFLEGLKAETLWIDCSTVNPSFTLEMAAAAQKRKIRFMDAPAAGTKAPAESGDLVFFVGGDDSDVEECRPFLEAMGKKVIHLGPQGRASAMKMVFNMLLATSMNAFAEAMSLGQSLGFSQDQLFNTLLGSQVVSPFISGKKEKMESGNFQTDFPLKLMQKDLHLATTTAYENGAVLPMTNVVKELYALAVKNDLGEEDFSAIYKLLNQ
ncbi:MAG: NAD(P)-dependent oxidoreductase [SAR324 cluster bacterium]|nr:NAD(P)-dependent oxidoreductase [SAR324 cluster bacterium]